MTQAPTGLIEAITGYVAQLNSTKTAITAVDTALGAQIDADQAQVAALTANANEATAQAAALSQSIGTETQNRQALGDDQAAVQADIDRWQGVLASLTPPAATP